MKSKMKQMRTNFVVCVILVSVLLAIHVWNSSNLSGSEKTTQNLYRFIARNLKYDRNGTLTVYGKFKDRFSPNDMLEINNISLIIKKIINDYEEQKTAQRERLRKHREQFSASVGTNNSLVSYSPLYRKSETNSTIRKNLISQNYFTKNRPIKNVNCGLLFEGNAKEVEKAKRLSKAISFQTRSKTFVNQTRDCEKFIKSKGYIMDSLTDEEQNFPIAYSIMAYKSPEQFEMLFRAIYRPQNVYCLHIDKKTPNSIFEEFSSIIKCFPNAFLASKRILVNWGYMSVLTQELVCMEDLLKYKKWKYFINLTGQEFPLRTNYEIVKILKIYNGANDLESTIKRANKARWLAAGTPPNQIRPVKGSVHITVNRKFVEYVVNNPVAKDFLNWTMRVAVPDETFFASLNHNPHLQIPGSYKGEPETDRFDKPFLTRFKNWGTGVFNWPCHGRRVRQICIFGIGDLPLLARRPEFFANKFYLYYQTYALQCMEELHYNRTRDVYHQQLEFQADYYENLEFIKHVV